MGSCSAKLLTKRAYRCVPIATAADAVAKEKPNSENVADRERGVWSCDKRNQPHKSSNGIANVMATRNSHRVDASILPSTQTSS